MNEMAESLKKLCPICGGVGYLVKSISAHGCDGTEEDCARTCPVEEAQQEQCQWCDEFSQVISAKDKSIEGLEEEVKRYHTLYGSDVVNLLSSNQALRTCLIQVRDGIRFQCKQTCHDAKRPQWHTPECRRDDADDIDEALGEVS